MCDFDGYIVQPESLGKAYTVAGIVWMAGRKDVWMSLRCNKRSKMRLVKKVVTLVKKD